MSATHHHHPELFLDLLNYVITNYLSRKPILDLVPRKLHERSPIFLGSKEDVEDIMAVIAKHKK